MKRKLLSCLLAFALVLAGITVSVSAAAPQILSAQATEVTAAGYRVTVQFSASAGVSRVVMPTWTEAGGQDDLVWHQATVSGDSASFYVPVSGHKNESGAYITHIYVYDNQGQFGIYGLNVTVPAQSAVNLIPSITAVETTEVTASGYRVTATFTAASGASRVTMPTWTEANGQDDLVWHEASISGNTATFYVPVSAHKAETGKYITHIYLYDTKGRIALKGLEVTVPSAQQPSTPSTGGSSQQTAFGIGEVTISEVTSAGYRVTAEVSAPAGVKRVTMPTWTEANGQDDLVWHEAAVSGTTATFYVSAAAHKGESGKYITHIYLYDNAGKMALKGAEAVLPAAASTPSTPTTPADKLEIKDISVTEVSEAGYRITATVTAPNGILKVEMPTWTEAGGQDDLVWHQATVSGTTATVYIPASQHKNETGTYITHIYLYDRTGAKVIAGSGAELPTATTSTTPEPTPPIQPTPAALSISDVRLSEVSAAGYRITATVTATEGISRVRMATWTEAGGQDDLVWQDAVVTQNQATCYIPASQHGNQTGVYTTHIFLYDLKGNQKVEAVSATVSDNSGSGAGTGVGTLSITKLRITELSANGFRITAQFNAPYGYSRVSAAVWSNVNGQDDLVWHDMQVSGNIATVYVPISEHGNTHGAYTVNMYVFQSSSQYATTGLLVPVP